jgi:radical SAM protein with 4Fe4S-binding SPASM domain
VEPGEFIQSRLRFRGIRGEKFSSYVALIWLNQGKEIFRETHWIRFDNKKRSIRISARIPEKSDECLIGLRVNCETPRRSDVKLLIEDPQEVKFKIRRKRPYLPQYLASLARRDLLPDPQIRERIRSKRKLLNHILVKIQALYLKNSLVLGYPLMAFVDPSNLCNYRCPLCPTGRQERLRSRTLLKYQDFKIIMDHIGKHLYKLHLYNWGEPFLNKDLIAMIKYAKRFDIIVESSTNLSILNESLVTGLIESELDYLIVAVDGMTDRTYSKYRIGGHLQRVLDNLDLLLTVKKRNHSPKPHIILSYLPNRFNEEELPQALQFFKQMDASFTVGRLRLDMCDEVIKTKEDITPYVGWLPRNRDLSVYDEDLNKSLARDCLWPWELVCIHPDGSVSPCCAVYSERFDFGNVLQSSFLRIWNGKKYREARKIIRKHRDNQDGNMPCNYCIRRGGFLDYQPRIHYNVF